MQRAGRAWGATSVGAFVRSLGCVFHVEHYEAIVFLLHKVAQFFAQFCAACCIVFIYMSGSCYRY